MNSLRNASSVLLVAALSAGLVSAATQTAQACGGCFGPRETEQSVTDHRMVLAITPTQSVLWDQLRYSGSPQDFSWVLPVSGNVTIELASGEFFDRLDAATATVVQGPVTPSCGGSGGLLAFGGASSPSNRTTDENMSVVVLNQSVVGPYETVTLRSTDAMALDTWLGMHGYVVPPPIAPVIAAYVAQRSDFVALRLGPGQGVSAMQPVRVISHSASMLLPLRMVAAGISDKVGITLWVFGQGRYEAANFGNATISASDLEWNWDTAHSNYTEVFAQTLLATQNGRAWITESANGINSGSLAYTIQYGSTGAQASADTLADWQLASDHQNPAVWVTRMRTSLGANFLDADLTLQAARDASRVSQQLVATRTTGTDPRAACAPAGSFTAGAGPGVACAVQPSRLGSRSPLALLALAAGAASVIAARKRRR